jgi:hypothetical protein
MRVPTEKNNHIIDGLRYAYEADMEGYSPIPEKQPVQVSKFATEDQVGWAKRY